MDLAVAWSGGLGGNPVPEEKRPSSVTASTSPAAPGSQPSPQPGPSPSCSAFAIRKAEKGEERFSSPARLKVAPSPTTPAASGAFLKKGRFQSLTPTRDSRLMGVGPKDLHSHKDPKYFTYTVTPEARGWERRWTVGSSNSLSHRKPQQSVSAHQAKRT